MEPIRRRRKKHTVFGTVYSQRQWASLVINVILCVLGLVFGYVYLAKGLTIGWLFIAAFTFFLFAQFARPTDYDI